MRSFCRPRRCWGASDKLPVDLNEEQESDGDRESIYGADFELTFDLEPAAGQWTLSSGDAASPRATYEGASYVLELDERRQAGNTTVMFTLSRGDGGSFTIKQYALSARADIEDLHRLWIPHFTERHITFMYMQRHLPMSSLSPTQRYPLVDTRSCADARSPLILGINRAGDVTLGVGLIDQRIETIMSDRISTHYGMPDFPRGRMLFEFKRPHEGFVLGPLTQDRDGFFVGQGASWFDTTHQYRQTHDEIMNHPVEPSPDPCFDAVWVHWVYQPGDWGTGRIEDVDEELMLKAARIAGDIGLTTILNSGSYRFGTKTASWAYPADCGDYLADPGEYPDLRATTRKLHEMGQRLCLWIDPFAVGKNSQARAQLRDALIPDTNFLCPRNPRAQQHMAELMARLLRDYDADGYTVDCGGNVPLIQCTANHEHNFTSIGMALDHCYAKMKPAMDQVKPDAIIEFSHNYCNINCLNYASAFRATDSGDAGDYELDRRLCVLLRSFIPPGKAVHVDPIWWRLDEDEQVVAKMLSTAIFSAVPHIGADLINIPTPTATCSNAGSASTTPTRTTSATTR